MTMTADVSISGKPFDAVEALADAKAATGRELSLERQERYKWLLTRYPQRIAAILPVLRLVEEEWGVIDDAAMNHVAILLDCPPSHVYGVVTFYTHFHREGTGRVCLDVCMTLPCALRGAGALLNYLEAKLGIQAGETTADGLFTIRKVECLASCGSAPMLQCGDKYHELLTTEKVDMLIDEQRARAREGAAGVAVRSADAEDALAPPAGSKEGPDPTTAGPRGSGPKKKKKGGRS